MIFSDVVVGIDDSESSRAALRWAAGLADAAGWRLRAVHVLEWPVGLSATSEVGPGDVLQLPDHEVDRAYRHGMGRVFDEVDPSPEWRVHFAIGDVAEMLVRLAVEAQLLVIGSREHAAAGNMLAGGISHYCVSRSTRPVSVVPVEYLTYAARRR